MVWEWVQDKFINPMCHYYTLEATIVYGILLVLGVLATYKLLQYLKVKIDGRFFVAILPFIIMGGVIRALRDHDVLYSTVYWCSPFIYVILFSFTLVILLYSLGLERTMKNTAYSHSFKYHKIMLVIGLIFLFFNLVLVRISNFLGFSIVLGLVGLWALIFFGISYLKPKILSKVNAGIIVSHLLDASSTFTALTFFGHYEQHVLPTFLINIFGPWIMFPLKIIVVWAVLYVIDKYSDDKFFSNFLKIIILILGLALGIRDFLTVSML